MSKLAEYRKYQLQWMIDHGYSLDDLIDELLGMIDNGYEETALWELYAFWSNDVGFGGQLWACYDEWEESEKKEQ